MSNINYNIKLCGEYRLTVLDNKTVVSDTGWCKNTILSGGLVYLANNSFLDSLSFVDFGTDISNPGSFSLDSVITPCVNAELTDIPSNNIQYYPVDKSIQVYYSTYSSSIISVIEEVVNEFCIKTKEKIGFSRTVLPSPVTVNIGQNLNFEYRVSVDYTNESASNVEFVTHDGTSFYVPVTSKVFNLPNFDNDLSRAGRLIDTYPLLLLQNSEDLPSFGDSYPQTEIYAINNSQQQSTFAPSIVYSDIDNITKSYSVITEYRNLSAPLNSGVFDNINTALLKYKDTGVLLSRFGYPLTIYNSSLYSNPSAINSSNLLSLFYKYTWSETLTSTFQTPTTFTLSAPQLIPCNINLYVDLYPNSFITIHSNDLTAPNAPGNTSIIRVSLLSSYFYNITINYFSPNIDPVAYPYGPSPYKIIVFDNNNDLITDTGYVFPDIKQAWDYPNPALDSLEYYNDKLNRLSDDTIKGSISGTTIVSNLSVDGDKNYIDVLVNSPFTGTSWTIVLDTLEKVSSEIPPLDEITTIEAISSIVFADDGVFEALQTSCEESFGSGGQGIEIIPITIGTDSGWFGINYNAYGVPDKFDVEWNNNIYTSKYVGDAESNHALIEAGVPLSSINTAVPGNGSGALYIYKESVLPIGANIIVTAPLPGTAWTFDVICPNTGDPASSIDTKPVQYTFGPGIPVSAGPLIPDTVGLWLREGWVNDKPYYTSYELNGTIIWSISSWNLSIGNNLLFTSTENTEDITTISIWYNNGNPYTINFENAQFINTTSSISDISQINDGVILTEGLVALSQPINNIGNINDGTIVTPGIISTVSNPINQIGTAADATPSSSVITTSNVISQVMTTDNGVLNSVDVISCTSSIRDLIYQYSDGDLESLNIFNVTDTINYINSVDNGEFFAPGLVNTIDIINSIGNIDNGGLVSTGVVSTSNNIVNIGNINDGGLVSTGLISTGNNIINIGNIDEGTLT